MSTPASSRSVSTWLALAGWIAIASLAGGVGALASVEARDFYATLVQPTWAPPGWVFGPVWSTLYVMMGVSAWLVWRARPTNPVSAAARRHGLMLFGVQLALNALWSWIFFAWHRGALAFVEILVLWTSIVVLIAWFARVNRTAAWLLAPYLAWVSFAAALTWAMWRGNPGLL